MKQTVAHTPPALRPMARVVCDVGPLTSLGMAPLGERRVVPLLGGTVTGEKLSGRILEGGADWQIARADGVLEIDAHYVIETNDGALVEVRSQGVRHGPKEVMDQLAAGKDVSPEAYYFRTILRFTTGSTAWAHLNGMLAIAKGERRAQQVLLELFELT